jgi:hypothetical protein
MNNERSCCELTAFAVGFVGFWFGIWGVIFVNKWIFGLALVLFLSAVASLGKRE